MEIASDLSPEQKTTFPKINRPIALPGSRLLLLQKRDNFFCFQVKNIFIER